MLLDGEMEVSEHFLERILIKNVRNLNNIEIFLSYEKKKHLIITGKNGTGKTSLLSSIMEYLSIFDKSSISDIVSNKSSLNYYESEFSRLNNRHEELKDFPPEVNKEEIQQLKMQLEQVKTNLNNIQTSIDRFEKKVIIKFNDEFEIDKKYKEGNFIISYFSSSRVSQMTIPNGIEKVVLNDRYDIQSTIGQMFVKYLVDLKAKETFAKEAGDRNVSDKISKWFIFLESNLRELFENDSLKLTFDYNNYNFFIIEPGKDPYTLNELSSGFSSILNIVTEIIMRMEKNRSKFYDMEGIIIIDEIEAHLHVSLQKKVLKFLCDFFPNIQFIVSTHSPFIINSIENTIVFDLEKKILLEDLSAYSYKAILEGYFGVDTYSDIAKENIKEYKKLISLNDPTKEQIVKLNELKDKFEDVPDILSEEIKLELALSNLQRILRGEQL